jgi:hypothetical protein
VIADVNRALRGLLAPLLPAGCAVRFGAAGGHGSEPDDALASSQRKTETKGDGLVFFLAEVREDEKGGDTDWEDIRDADGRVVARRPPVRRFDLHYLVTTETPDPDVEAALLDAVLTAVDPGKRLAAKLLGESLAGRPVTLRLGDGVPYPLARTSLSVIANAPLVPPVVTDIAAPAESIRLGVAPPGRPTPPRVGPPPATGPRRWRGTTIQEDDDSP